MSACEYLQDIQYLELLQEKVVFKYDTYSKLLDEFLNFQIKNKKNASILQDNKEMFILKFYIEKDVMCQTIRNEDIKGLLTWMYRPLIHS